MKNSFTALVVLFAALVGTGHSLQCYRCQSQDGELYSPDQCNQHKVIENCTDENYTCVNYRSKTVKKNAAIEVQEKGCILRDECISLKARCNETAKNGSECESLCCDQKLCNDDFDEDIDPVLKCYHCDGPFPDGSLGLNGASSLNRSYGTDQCFDTSTVGKVPCLNGYCGRFFRRFEKENNAVVDVEIASCFSISKCNETMEFCDKSNNTALCAVHCCDTPLCNTASRGELFSLFSALIGFVAWQL